MRTSKALIAIVLFICVSPFAVGQDGKHLLVNYSIERTGWTPDNYQKVSTTTTYPELSYYMTWGSGVGGGSAEFYAPGIFSGIMGNVFVTTEDDSLQISNINILGFVFQHFFLSSVDETHSFGGSWGIDFLGHSLAIGAEEGSLNGLTGDAQELAQLKGVRLSFGGTYQFNLDDKILADAYLIYRLVYNSESAKANEKAFHGKGFRAHLRGRYYLNESWVAHADLMLESLNHEPTTIQAGDIAGKMGFTTFSLGIGYQWD